MISHSTSPIIFIHRMFGVAFSERLLFLLLLSHDRIVEIKVSSGAPRSPHPHAFSGRSLAHSHSHSHTLLYRSLCIYADDLTIIEMLFVRCFIFSRARLFISFLSFPSTSPSSSASSTSMCVVTFMWVFRSRFYYFGQKLWIKIKTIYVLSCCIQRTQHTRCLKR